MQEELLPDITYSGKMKMNYTAKFTSNVSAVVALLLFVPAYACLLYRFIYYNKVGYHLLNIYLTIALFICCTVLFIMTILMWIYYIYYPSSNRKVIQYVLVSILMVTAVMVIGAYFLFNPSTKDLKTTYNTCINITNVKESYCHFVEHPNYLSNYTDFVKFAKFRNWNTGATITIDLCLIIMSTLFAVLTYFYDETVDVMYIKEQSPCHVTFLAIFLPYLFLIGSFSYLGYSIYIFVKYFYVGYGVMNITFPLCHLISALYLSSVSLFMKIFHIKLKAKNSAGYSCLSLYIVGLSVWIFMLYIPDGVNVYAIHETFNKCCNDVDNTKDPKCSFIPSLDSCYSIADFKMLCDKYHALLQHPCIVPFILFVIYVISDYYIEDYLGYRGILPRSICEENKPVPPHPPLPDTN